MKRLNAILILCAICMSMFAQGVCGHPKEVRNLLRTAEVYIDGFYCDSIVAVYPYYNIFRKKEFKDKKFDTVPTYTELEQYLDFKHPVLGNVLVKTSNNEIWLMMGKYNNVDDFAFIKGSDKDMSFFLYLETMKPEKIYSLFGQGYFVFEKDGKRQLYNRKRQECDLPEMYKQYGYDINHFNRFDYPRDKKTPLVIDYGK